MKVFFDRHDKVMLEFSGGKDSLAMLYLLRAYWDRLEVVWCNGGNPHPETLAVMEKIAAEVPNFTVVTGRQPEWVAEYGYPVDVVPFDSTLSGNRVHQRETPVRMAPFQECCFANLWKPMYEYRRKKGFDAVIVGTKSCDPMRAPVEGPFAMDGAVEYWFPLWHWNDQHVLNYLGDKLPEAYRRGCQSSFDCLNCTAYLKENKQRIRELSVTHPEVYAEIKMVHRQLTLRMQEEADLLKELYDA